MNLTLTMVNHDLPSPSHSIMFFPAQDKQYKGFKSLEPTNHSVLKSYSFTNIQTMSNENIQEHCFILQSLSQFHCLVTHKHMHMRQRMANARESFVASSRISVAKSDTTLQIYTFEDSCHFSYSCKLV